MSDKKAMKDEGLADEEPQEEIDQAIDDLRGVLEQDAAGTANIEASEDQPFGGGDFSMDDFPETAGADAPDFSGGLDASEPSAPDAGLGSADFGGDFAAQSASDAPAGATGATGTVANADIIMDIPVEVQIVLGKTRMKVSNLMSLDEGATISLDRKIGETVDIMVNGRMIGHGEITVLEEDETRFGVRLTEILGTGK
ncbi:flagellar motor switch protein FliN [Hoeflea prorocentri]|uniref:Flagellar motor switch protein FliN n=1 Tax=Hoeflea prorocentri TaxID=1922333 RepID=A0A9X3UKT2_9HYPH|nr:flagellar motor switch protein FliN [Hoeflea prorocentri]MCY6382406.1 flagellar motor switch protein FliN [Hoeflea prorocentri]MDA5400206.1 flagellar motor switch protein FliN [Hoeflea prorocentri]